MRDLLARWTLEEAGLPYQTRLLAQRIGKRSLGQPTLAATACYAAALQVTAVPQKPGDTGMTARVR